MTRNLSFFHVWNSCFLLRLGFRHASRLTTTRTIEYLPLQQLRTRSSRQATQSYAIIPGYSSINVLETDNYILFGSRTLQTTRTRKGILAPSSVGHNKMKCSVEFLSTPTADTPGTTLLLHFDNKRYLIGNVAEGTQRAAIQRKLGLLKVRDIFLTGSIGWSTAGGLLGMILTLADAFSTSREERRKQEYARMQRHPKDGRVEPEMEKFGIHGGRNLTHLLATARRFIFRHGMPLTTTEFKAEGVRRKDWNPTWEDENIKVWVMVLASKGQPENARKRSHDDFVDSEGTGGLQEAGGCDNGQADQLLSSVVSAMFDSNWRLDRLIKKKLSQVQLPATIFVRDSEGNIEKYEGPTDKHDVSFTDIDVLVRNPWPGALIDDLPRTTPSTESTCYIIKNHPQRGKFDPKKAVALGVPKGADFGRLTKGESITVSGGRVVTPQMVLGEGKEGSGFAVVELPSQTYVKALLSREEWSSVEVMSGVEAIIWILGPNVSNDPALQKFMKDRSRLRHIISSVDCCANYLALESAAAAALRLNLIDPTTYPTPTFNNETTLERDSNLQGYEKARSGYSILLEPKFMIRDEGIIQYLDTQAVKDEMPQEVLDLATAGHMQVTSHDYQAQLDGNQADILCKDAEITTLGTGSALPSKYRNVSATLVRIPEYGNFLFDCGENTLGQLKRVFGEELSDVLQNLKAIWISHLHADHHLGTASVIKAWSKETEKREWLGKNELVVASHDGMLNWLREYAEVEDYGYRRVCPIAINHESNYGYYPRPEQVRELGFASIQACPVTHCLGAMAVAFSFPNGFKVAYSGDCRPSDRFVEIGQGATLLIHEATFDDELRGDAIAKKHSTTSEALDIGKRMNARRILLTHFSQRYQKIPVMDSRGGKDQVAVVAFDYMKTKLGNFPKIEAFRPALMKLYEEKEDQ